MRHQQRNDPQKDMILRVIMVIVLFVLALMLVAVMYKG
jgi:hypothetical protein